MMNIIQLQNNLKNLSDQQLSQAMQMPSENTPPFLVVSELNRRKKVRDEFQAQQADQNKTTVAQDVVAAAGVPQQAASDMAQSLAPQTDMTNNTGIMSLPSGGEPQRMAGGGVVKMQEGRTTPSGISEIDRARAAGLDSFTLGELFPDFGISIDLDGTGRQAVPGPGRTSEPAPEDPRLDIARLTGETTLPALTPEEQAQHDAMIAADEAATANAIAARDAQQDPGDGGGGVGGGGGGTSGYEQMLMDAAANADRKAKQDKWFTLAQMGLSLMSSQQPNFLAALGEAGTSAIPAFQQARDTAEATKFDAEKGLFALQQQRAAAAAAAANARKPKPIDASLIELYQKQANSLQESLASGNLNPGQMSSAQERLDGLNTAIGQLTNLYVAQRGIDPSQLGIAAVDTTIDGDMR